MSSNTFSNRSFRPRCSRTAYTKGSPLSNRSFICGFPTRLAQSRPSARDSCGIRTTLGHVPHDGVSDIPETPQLNPRMSRQPRGGLTRVCHHGYARRSLLRVAIGSDIALESRVTACLSLQTCLLLNPSYHETRNARGNFKFGLTSLRVSGGGTTFQQHGPRHHPPAECACYGSVPAFKMLSRSELRKFWPTTNSAH